MTAQGRKPCEVSLRRSTSEVLRRATLDAPVLGLGRLQDIAHEYVLNTLWFYASAFDSRLDCGGTELVGRNA